MEGSKRILYSTISHFGNGEPDNEGDLKAALWSEYSHRNRIPLRTQQIGHVSNSDTVINQGYITSYQPTLQKVEIERDRIERGIKVWKAVGEPVGFTPRVAYDVFVDAEFSWNLIP